MSSSESLTEGDDDVTSISESAVSPDDSQYTCPGHRELDSSESLMSSPDTDKPGSEQVLPRSNVIGTIRSSLGWLSTWSSPHENQQQPHNTETQSGKSNN